MKPIIVLLLLTFWSVSSSADDGTKPINANTFYRINPKREKAAFYLLVRTDATKADSGDDRVFLNEVDVFAADKRTILQRLSFPIKSVPSENGDGAVVLGSDVEQGDFNFDGYLDFQGLMFEEGGSGGFPGVHFLFDPRTHRYVSSPELDSLMSTSYDTEQKCVHSFERGGGMYSTAETYRWKGGKLLLITRVKRDRDDKGYYTEYSDFSVPSHPKIKRSRGTE